MKLTKEQEQIIRQILTDYLSYDLTEQIMSDISGHLAAEELKERLKHVFIDTEADQL